MQLVSETRSDEEIVEMIGGVLIGHREVADLQSALGIIQGLGSKVSIDIGGKDSVFPTVCQFQVLRVQMTDGTVKVYLTCTFIPCQVVDGSFQLGCQVWVFDTQETRDPLSGIRTVDADMAERIVVVGKFGDNALCIDSGLLGGEATIQFDVGCQISEMLVVKQLPEVHVLGVDGSLKLLVASHREIEFYLSDICQEIGLGLDAAIC